MNEGQNKEGSEFRPIQFSNMFVDDASGGLFFQCSSLFLGLKA